MIVDDVANRLMQLFRGLDKAHGVYIVNGKAKQGQKVKGKASTVMGAATLGDWVDHVQGKRGLGIVPIMEDNRVVWSAIDIDRYDIDLVQLISRIPSGLVPVLSKSGGLHVYAFFKNPILASGVRKAMSKVAADLGFGGAEIFPKQGRILVDRGDVGNWLNMPYFNIEKTDRPAISVGKGKSIENLSVEEFLELADKSKVTLEQLSNLSITPVAVDDTDLPDGPPCLQHLVRLGFPPGTRNNGLFNLGVYLRLKHDDWKDLLDEWNRKYMKPPLTSAEVQMVIRSLDRKTYHYRCEDSPIRDHCDKDTCLTRPYGIGPGDVELPELNGLTKVNTLPPVYFVEVNGVRLGPLASVDFLSQHRFQKCAFESLGIVTPIIKDVRWRTLLTKALEELVTIEVPEDSSSVGQLMAWLESFCTEHRATEERNELLLGRVYVQEERYYHFRMRDFMTFLNRQRFTDFKSNEIAGIFRNQGLESKGIKVRGKYVNVWIATYEPDEENKPSPKKTRKRRPY